jgi:hypothetical protein
MTSEDREQQAAQFLAFHAKRGQDAAEDFGAWSAGKDFAPADKIAIAAIVHRQLLATEAASVDLTDYLYQRPEESGHAA